MPTNMPRVEFHILSETGGEARWKHACALVEQAQLADEKIFIRAEQDVLQRIDDLLWTFRDHAFIPHEFVGANTPSHPRIVALLGYDEPLPAGFSLLINLHTSLPAQLQSASKVIEIVDADATNRQQARERYKQYRERNCQLETINH